MCFLLSSKKPYGTGSVFQVEDVQTVHLRTLNSRWHCGPTKDRAISQEMPRDDQPHNTVIFMHSSKLNCYMRRKALLDYFLNGMNSAMCLMIIYYYGYFQLHHHILKFSSIISQSNEHLMCNISMSYVKQIVMVIAHHSFMGNTFNFVIYVYRHW